MKKIKIVLVVLLLIIGIETVILYNKTEDDIKQSKEVVLNNDITKFSKEYESYNAEMLYNHEVLDVEINKDAQIYITSAEDVIEVLKNEKALIYFGFSTCPWCRNMIEPLVEASIEKNEPIYYVDILKIRNTYTLKDGKVEENKKGTDAYYDLLKYLDDVLENYIITDTDNNTYDTKTKRIYGPSIVTVNSGNIVDFKSGTLEEIEDPYTRLNEKQYNELLTEYKNMINNLNSPTCGGDVC